MSLVPPPYSCNLHDYLEHWHNHWQLQHTSCVDCPSNVCVDPGDRYTPTQHECTAEYAQCPIVQRAVETFNLFDKTSKEVKQDDRLQKLQPE